LKQEFLHEFENENEDLHGSVHRIVCGDDNLSVPCDSWKSDSGLNYIIIGKEEKIKNFSFFLIKTSENKKHKRNEFFGR